MKTTLFCLLLFCAGALAAQSKPCSEYAKILQKLEATFQGGKGNLDDCLHLVDALRACDPAQEETAIEWTHKIFDAIKAQKMEAEAAKAKAIAEERKAREATRVAGIARDTAEKAKARAIAEEQKAKEATRIATAALDSARVAKARADTLIQEVLKAQITAKNITLNAIQAIRLLEEKVAAPDAFQQDYILEALKIDLLAYADSIIKLKPFHDQYSEGWGYKDAFGDIVIYPSYDTAYEFVGDFALVMMGGIYFKIDKTGIIVSVDEPKNPWRWVPLTSGMEIPQNAIPGGYSLQKVTTFICRATFDQDVYGGMHPGKFENDSCHFGWGGREIVRDSFEILVLPEHVEAQWTNLIELDKYMSADPPWVFVAGGWNDNEIEAQDVLLVVRANHDGELIPGKFWAEHCNFPYKGQEVLTQDFELLVVRPKR